MPGTLVESRPPEGTQRTNIIWSAAAFDAFLAALDVPPGPNPGLERLTIKVPWRQYQPLVDMFDRPEQANDGLRDLFSRKAPWDK